MKTTLKGRQLIDLTDTNFSNCYKVHVLLQPQNESQTGTEERLRSLVTCSSCKAGKQIKFIRIEAEKT